MDCNIDLNSIKAQITNAINSLKEISYLGITIDCVFVEDSININASVVKKAKTKYELMITTGVFESIGNIVKYYTDHLVESDFVTYKFSQEDTFFRLIGDNSDKEEFQNRVALEMLDCLVCHEIGHIVLGHCEEPGVKFCEFGLDKDKKGYNYQCLEMCADWYGVNKALGINIWSFKCLQTLDRDGPAFRWLIRRELALVFISQFLLFTTILGQGIDYNNVSNYEFLSHPHPLVRRLYISDAVFEACVSRVKEITSWEDDRCIDYVEHIFKSSFEDIEKFLPIKYISEYDSDIRNKQLRTIYETLRSPRYLNTIPYKPLINYFVSPFVKNFES